MQAAKSSLRIAILASFVLLLIACGGGGGSDSPPSPPAAAPDPVDETPAELSVVTAISVSEEILITFNEAMNPDSLKLEGFLASLADHESWNDDNTELRLKPMEGAWESGVQTLTGFVEDAAGNITEIDVDFKIRLVFETFQEAVAVIGQPDFESVSSNSPDANTLDWLEGNVTFSNGRMWVPDTYNHRLLGFDGVPVTNNVSASWVVGQPDFSSNSRNTGASNLERPMAGLEHDGRFYALDTGNSRILVFDDVPLSQLAGASGVIGQDDFVSSLSNCTEDGLRSPRGMWITGRKFIVADSGNHRVLIWNEVPTDGAPADLVLGQADMTYCVSNDDNQDQVVDSNASSRTLSVPTDVWSDGERLLVADLRNNRVLIWNSFPSTSFQPADLVLGQSNFENGAPNDDDQDGSESRPSASTLWWQEGTAALWSNGLQIVLTDAGNSRVLIWNNFPTDNFQPADVVLGQSNFVLRQVNDSDQDGEPGPAPNARTMQYPMGIGVHREKLVVLDSENRRALVFRAR